MLLFELIGAEVIEGPVYSLGVVEAFDESVLQGCCLAKNVAAFLRCRVRPSGVRSLHAAIASPQRPRRRQPAVLRAAAQLLDPSVDV